MKTEYIKEGGHIELQFELRTLEDIQEAKELPFFDPFMLEEDWREVKKEFGTLYLEMYKGKDLKDRIAIGMRYPDGAKMDIMRDKLVEKRDLEAFERGKEYVEKGMDE